VTAGLPRSCACSIHLIPEYYWQNYLGREVFIQIFFFVRAIYPNRMAWTNVICRGSQEKEGRENTLQDTGLYEP
jgi:hypothetical protein